MMNESSTANQKNTGDQPDPPPQANKRRRHWVISLLRIMAISYVTVLVMLVLMEAKLLFPGAYLSSEVPPQPFASQPWQYSAEDGSTITGRLLERPGSKRTVLFFHGNGVRAAWLDDWTTRISRLLDANVLAAEYRGFQDVDVTPSESNLIADSLCAHDALCNHYGLRSEDLIVYGRSLGGGCAAAVAAERNTKTLILDRTFDSVANVASDKFPIFPIRMLMRNQFDSLERLRGYKGRLIQIHGTTDEVVPIAHGQRLYDSIPASDKVFLKVPGMYHNDPIPSKTLDEVSRLVDRIVN